MTDHDSTVLILGAGFSSPAGHPVMAEFRKVVDEFGNDPESPLAPDERLQFKHVLDYRRHIEALHGYLTFDLDNLEILFGVLDMESSLASEDDSVKTTRADLIFTLVKTLELTRKPLSNPIREQVVVARAKGNRKELRERTKYPGHPLVEYAKFAEHLRPHDAVVTFNYDTVIEEALLANSIGPLYGFNDFVWPEVAASIPVLKLHGSVNFKQQNGGTVEIVDFELLDQPTTAYYAGGTPLIVPPTWNKGTMTGVTQLVWQEAARSLRKAARIVFIGYSLPETDLGFRYLLASCLLATDRFPEIDVVDPDHVVRKRYSDFFAYVLMQHGRYNEYSTKFPNVSLRPFRTGF